MRIKLLPDKGKLNLNAILHWVKGGSNKWRLAFLVFAAVFAVVLTINLTYNSIQWDEVTHLNGGLSLLRSDFHSYFKFNAFYPPMYDLFTAGFFGVAGINVLTARMVSVVFSLLALFAVFEFGYHMYSPKVGLLASIFLGLMPGFIWLSRLALIETMLIFFFTLTALFFLAWLRNGKNKYLILSGLTMGIGLLTKYQMVVIGAIMLTGIVVLGWGQLKRRFSRFPIIIVIALLVVVPWIIVSYQVYSSRMFDTWLYALNMGNPDRSLYSLGLNSVGVNRFPHFYSEIPDWTHLPIFYLLEMTAPYFDIHPVSLFLYILSFGGLVLFAWRRKSPDKYLLIWFAAVYLFFTSISNKQWRYITPIFPVLALSAACLVSSGLETTHRIWRNKQLTISERRFAQVGAGFLIVFVLMGTVYSVNDASYWIAKDQVQIPIQGASQFVAGHILPNESIVVLNAQNLYSGDMVRFYLNAAEKNNTILQYPAAPVDTYTISFNITDLIALCKANSVKYVFTYEFGGTVNYFNSTLSLRDIYQMLYDSGNFTKLLENGTTIFGVPPRRIFVLTFLG
jgi:4-amino-4-deoxy-L-arabinose transferase-like glycosyltransferase